MKIKKVWFGLIVVTIVFVILILGYGVYESIFKANEYVRIYQSSVDLNEEDRDGVFLNDLEVKILDYDIHEYKMEDGTTSDSEKELYVDISLTHNDEIILEPSFEWIIYDENNKVLSYSNTINVGNEETKKYLYDFVKEKYNTNDVNVFWDNTLSLSMSNYNINNETTDINRRIDTHIPIDYNLDGKLYVRIFNIKYNLESAEETLKYYNDMIEFVIDNK